MFAEIFTIILIFSLFYMMRHTTKQKKYSKAQIEAKRREYLKKQTTNHVAINPSTSHSPIAVNQENICENVHHCDNFIGNNGDDRVEVYDSDDDFSSYFEVNLIQVTVMTLR